MGSTKEALLAAQLISRGESFAGLGRAFAEFFPLAIAVLFSKKATLKDTSLKYDIADWDKTATTNGKGLDQAKTYLDLQSTPTFAQKKYPECRKYSSHKGKI